MNSGRTIFSQLADFVPALEFRKCVARYRGNWRTRSFSCWDQFLCMAFGQLTGRESLRETITCLRAFNGQLYHAGIRGRVSRSTLADANESRDWRIYADLAAVLIVQARTLYGQEPLASGVDWADLTLLTGTTRPVYAFDSTTIDLCLSLFPWARFRKRKSAVKLHTLLDLRGNIPCFIHVSSGKMADMTAMDLLPIEAGAFYIFDRGYNDFARLYRFTTGLASFITLAKKTLDYRRVERRPVSRADHAAGLRSDAAIRLCGPKTAKRYPQRLRRISYYFQDWDKRVVILTNNFDLPATTIAELYRRRWAVETFFKWIKQHLRLKAFYGNSINAVKTQVWISVCVYLLIAIMRKELKISCSLGDLQQILSLALFQKEPLSKGFFDELAHDATIENHKQLILFDL